MKLIKPAGLVLLLALVLIQFVPVNRSNPPVTREIAPNPDVHALIKRACYDCHSNQTQWPWYSYLAPASWLVTHDVEEGRKHVNFTEWDRYDEKKRRRKLEEIAEEVEEGAMPLKKYLLLHPEARLSDAERLLLVNWVRRMAAGGPDGPISTADEP